MLVPCSHQLALAEGGYVTAARSREALREAIRYASAPSCFLGGWPEQRLLVRRGAPLEALRAAPREGLVRERRLRSEATTIWWRVIRVYAEAVTRSIDRTIKYARLIGACIPSPMAYAHSRCVQTRSIIHNICMYARAQVPCSCAIPSLGFDGLKHGGCHLLGPRVPYAPATAGSLRARDHYSPW